MLAGRKVPSCNRPGQVERKRHLHRMNKSVFPASLLTAALLCGCTSPVVAPVVVQPEQPVSFSCRPTDQSGAGHESRVVTITRDPSGSRLRLVLEKERTEILMPVSGSGGQLFSDAEFAVRVGPDHSVLTDVENIRTYTCIRAGMRHFAKNSSTP